jgi:glyoxylate/hydroxypyruvate reductase A
MVEYVSHAVLGLHRDSAEYRRQQQDGVWRPLPVKTAAERRVGVLGLGSLGQAVLGRPRPLRLRLRRLEPLAPRRSTA